MLTIVMYVHSHQTLKKDEFYALLSVADLALITPLRDGMNTTSMEFVIAQERSKKSPSVLSEFMGISKEMAEALQVNPWNLGVSTRLLLVLLCRGLGSVVWRILTWRVLFLL
jgi:trehalose-6-phosphate synthase